MASLEQALRDAGIAPFNLVKVSSIFPPYCQLVAKEEGLKALKPGQIVYLVMSENSTNEAHRLISASVGIAIPNNPVHYGYLSEHHSFGQSEKEAGVYAEQLAAYMLATTLGKNFDINQIWEQEQEKKLLEISSLTKDGAKEILLKNVETENESQLLSRIQKLQAEASEELEKKSNDKQ